MQEFLIILKGDGMNHLSPDELQQVMVDYQKWVADLDDQYLGGQRLEDRGSLHEGKEGKILTDGPFLESKEIIAGYMLIAAKDQKEADRIAQTSPHLGLYTLEVRPINFPKMS